MELCRVDSKQMQVVDGKQRFIWSGLINNKNRCCQMISSKCSYEKINLFINQYSLYKYMNFCIGRGSKAKEQKKSHSQNYKKFIKIHRFFEVHKKVHRFQFPTLQAKHRLFQIHKQGKIYELCSHILTHYGSQLWQHQGFI